ncbi:hypothetical protein [Laedolimicola ammoniilytica]|uniref:Uncharacterized protein n=1 Tax=Laedolimicola ammoniilytica TaxID=2981771 RepID=A0ABT2RZ51_9FIRM|nr:hypothetical protein [Laedolimicola ammoniilytica]MCU6697614.1 hypothetical protein [Laedolimicola ammoniilytica]SCI36270.1 Uncharacterised protein [uncultured Clostridium sp.]
MKFWKNQSIRRKEVSFFLAMVLFGVLKEFLVYNLPIMAVPKGIHDDWIMVHMADALRSGQWLGEYNDLTLTKGMFFPLYLAVLNFLRLSYLSVSALLYTVSCMIFVYALRPLLKKYWACFTLYLVLLWNPVSYSVQAFQRVYRNSISYIQVLLIFGGLLALWLRRKEPVKKQILWLLTAAVGMVTFFYTREDAIWVEPFLLVFLLVYLGTMFFSWKKEHRREYVGKAVLVLLPFLSVWGAGQLIAQENDNHYNIRLTNELQKGGFAEMYKSMMAVKPEEDIPGVTMTREKIARMCDECPTLEKLEPYIQSSRLYWAGSGENEKDWEVRDGWVFWIFRTALAQAGYYTDGGTVNQVCLQIRDELEAAMDEGRLTRQATMPSTYMSPWREGYLGDLFGALGKAIAYTTTYDEMETLVYLYSEPDENGGIPLFERMTGDKAVWYESDLVEMAGWYASYEGMEGVTLQAEATDGTVLGTAEFTESDDIAAYLAGQGIEAPGSEKCRFSLKLSVKDKPQTVYLKAYRNGTLLDSYELSEDLTRVESGASCLNLDWYWDVPERHGFLAKINYKGVLLNGIRQVYHVTGAVAAAAGALAYVALCVRMLKRRLQKVKDEDGRDLSVWLTLSALLASYFVLLGGISYSEISGWNAILYWYLSGAYPIMIAFEALAVLFLVQELREKVNQ